MLACASPSGAGLCYRPEGAPALSDVLLGLHSSQPSDCPLHLEPGSVPPVPRAATEIHLKCEGKSYHPGIQHVCSQCGQPARALPGPMLSTREGALAGHDDQSVPVRGWPGVGVPIPTAQDRPSLLTPHGHVAAETQISHQDSSTPAPQWAHCMGNRPPPQVGSCRALERKRETPATPGGGPHVQGLLGSTRLRQCGHCLWTDCLRDGRSGNTRMWASALLPSWGVSG